MKCPKNSALTFEFWVMVAEYLLPTERVRIAGVCRLIRSAMQHKPLPNPFVRTAWNMQTLGDMGFKTDMRYRTMQMMRYEHTPNLLTINSFIRSGWEIQNGPPLLFPPTCWTAKCTDMQIHDYCVFCQELRLVTRCRFHSYTRSMLFCLSCGEQLAAIALRKRIDCR